jgi:hypothetical protein
MPRKVAEMLRSDEVVCAALTRASALVRSRGLGSRVVERILLSSPTVCADTLRLASQGVCGGEGQTFRNVTDAVNGPDLHGVWRAGVLASWAEFVSSAISRTALKPQRVYGTGWANAETAFWAAGKHIIDKDDAFLTALFMDTGLVALMYALPEVYTAFSTAKVARPIEDFELEAFGFNHEDVSSSALKLFKFPEEMAEEARTHHAPLLSLGMTGKVLRAAVVAVSQAGGDFGLGSEPFALDRSVLEGALLRPEHEEELRSVAAHSLERANRFESASGSNAA